MPSVASPNPWQGGEEAGGEEAAGTVASSSRELSGVSDVPPNRCRHGVLLKPVLRVAVPVRQLLTPSLHANGSVLRVQGCAFLCWPAQERFRRECGHGQVLRRGNGGLAPSTQGRNPREREDMRGSFRVTSFTTASAVFQERSVNRAGLKTSLRIRLFLLGISQPNKWHLFCFFLLAFLLRGELVTLSDWTTLS